MPWGSLKNQGPRPGPWIQSWRPRWSCSEEWPGVATKGNKRGWRMRTTWMPTTNQGGGRDVYGHKAGGAPQTPAPPGWLCFPGPWPCLWRKGAVKEGCTPGEDSHVTRTLAAHCIFEAYTPASKKEITVSFVGAELPKYPTKDQKRRAF